MSVAAVEIEVSLQAYEQETKDGGYWNSLKFLLRSWEAHPYSCLVISTCQELGISVVAYSYVLLSQSSPLPDPPTALLATVYLLVRSRTVRT
jgi:hypothetical protein